jgi:hypothetical protein
VNFECKFCQKKFVKESTLLAHLCEPKRRFNQQNEQGVQIGFKAYLKFYEITQGSAKLKTYDDFCNSNFYIAFVRFGRWAVDIRAINVNNLVEWLLKHNHKLDYWTKETLYISWLQEYLRREPVQDAIERALKEMQDYADSDLILQNNFANYFLLGSSNRICKHISDGRISAWVVYNCSSGIEWLSRLNPEQLNIVMPYIDPDFWQKKFKDYLADAEWCKMILEKAGL